MLICAHVFLVLSSTVNIFHIPLNLWNWKIYSFFYLSLNDSIYYERAEKNGANKIWYISFKMFCDSFKKKQMMHIHIATVYINFYGSNEKKGFDQNEQKKKLCHQFLFLLRYFKEVCVSCRCASTCDSFNNMDSV